LRVLKPGGPPTGSVRSTSELPVLTRTSAFTTHATGRDRLAGHLAMVLFAAMIASSFSVGALALQHIEPAPLNSLRYAIAAAMVGVFTFGIRRHRLALPPATWRFAVIGGLMAVYFLTMFIALTMTAPVSTSAVFTLVPIMTAFFGVLLVGQVVRPVVGVSLAIAAVGALWMIFDADVSDLMGFEVGPGESIYFLGCIAHAIATPLLRRFDRGEPLIVANFFILSFIAIWMTLYGLPGMLRTDWAGLPPVVWWSLGYLAVFPTAITFLLMQFASKRLPAAKVLAYGYLVPAFVIVIEGVSGRGWAAPPILIGAAITCLGLLVLYFLPDS